MNYIRIYNMELSNITGPVPTSRKTVCLNMIVKDESHIMVELLTSVYKYIDYFVIVDTGSTDNTIELINTFAKNKNIKGEVFTRKWVDFGTNRTEALDLCKGKGDYVWVIDADNFVIGTIDFSVLSTNLDSYTVLYKSSVSFWRCQIVKNDGSIKWKWHDVIHENLGPANANERITAGRLEGGKNDYYIQDFHLGSRSLDPSKYDKDIALLEKGVIDRPEYPRYRFYLAQSYNSARKYEYAIVNYRKRLNMGGFLEEVYQSLYQIGIATRQLYYQYKKYLQDKSSELAHSLPVNISEVHDAFMVASKYSPHRAEPLYELAMFYKNEHDFENGYKYAKQANMLKRPYDGLFIEDYVYNYAATDLLALCAHYSRRYDESFRLHTLLLSNADLPKEHIERIKNNLEWDKKKVVELHNIVNS